MRITCLVKRWKHHTASGGYDRLATELGASIVSRGELVGLHRESDVRYLTIRLAESPIFWTINLRIGWQNSKL